VSSKKVERTITTLRLEYWQKAFEARIKKIPNDHWMWEGTTVEVSGRMYALSSPHPSKPNRAFVYAHHITWWMKHGGDVEAHLRLKNTCGHRLCINPDHWADASVKTPEVSETKSSIAVVQNPNEAVSRNMSIVRDRFHPKKPLTIPEIGAKYGISRQRVHQILNKYTNSQ
jgi:hypothetical protein